MKDERWNAGPGGALARGSRRLLILGSIATATVALWLMSVIAFVLPAHDPARLPFWRIVLLGLLAFSALSGAWLIRGPRSTMLKWSMRVASVAALAAGLTGIAQMMARANQGRDFEGYIVLMGIVLVGHGAAAALDTLVSARDLRSPGSL